MGQIYPVKGIWLIDITKGKTENALRRVPVHEKLLGLGLGLGLVEFCNAVRDAGHVRLFPHLVDGKNGFKKNMCRTFGNHLDATEVNRSGSVCLNNFPRTISGSLTG